MLTALLAGAAATLVPLYLGIATPWFAPRIIHLGSSSLFPFLAAVASGILFWFFLDVMGVAALLDVNQPFGLSYNQDLSHVTLIVLFTLGVGGLFWMEKSLIARVAASTETTEVPSSLGHGLTSIRHFTFAVAIAAALGIGFHAFGEGIEIGAVIPSSTSILEAIGGFYPGTAYVLHKLLEGFVVGVVALLAGATGWKKLGILGLISGLPTILGFFVGVPQLIAATYFFALGGAGTVYIAIRLIPVFTKQDFNYRLIAAFLIGFFAMYFAGLLHA